MKYLGQQALALVEVFFVSDTHEFCFTPTFHGVLHLPDIILVCGPLLNVSQFHVENVSVSWDATRNTGCALKLVCITSQMQFWDCACSLVDYTIELE